MCKGNLLIIDDTPDNLRVLSQMLTEQGYIVRKALNGARALASIQNELPDLILLDINMPDLNGYEVCQRLKSSGKTEKIPVIFISALDEVIDKITAFKVGGVDYINKPFQLEEVLIRVENHLKLYQLHHQLEQHNQQLRQEIEQRKKIEQELRFSKLALKKANEKLNTLSIIDSMTGIPNRRRFDEYLLQEWKRLARDNQPLSLILCDIDFFKNYNDTYGHIAGDNCLNKVAQALKTVVNRSSDLVARFGGEEFAIILPDTNEKGVKAIAKNVNIAIQNLKIPHAQSNVSNYVTISVGGSTQIPEHKQTPQNLIHQADMALYLAKQQGRNCFATQNIGNIEKSV
ncbi:MAG: diguanylate cyclase [Crocosphaera sp.]|nr:diguanylate cyclase [Crocosphaera sp.]